jgi:hypothetical protein
LCKELGPSLLDCAQLGLMKQLPRWNNNKNNINEHQSSPTELLQAISIVDSIVRSLVMVTGMINSTAMKVFFGINNCTNNFGTSPNTGTYSTDILETSSSSHQQKQNIIYKLLPRLPTLGIRSLWDIHNPTSILHRAY